jgi:tetratricopeptide (TPR) repeat protein
MAWCAYDLEDHDAAREALRVLLGVAPEHTNAAPQRSELAAEALELLALSFAADHQASEAAAVLDAWGRPHYDLELLRRMAQLFTSRALYDEAIQAWETVLERYPLHPHAAGAAVELLRVVELHEGGAQAHALAATWAPRFAPDAEWARHADTGEAPSALQPAWQSRLLEEDLEVARADSVAAALAEPAAAARHMARRLRRAAVFEHQRARTDSLGLAAALERAAQMYEQTLELFAAADDVATTWLYLGEARFELERYIEAADAYASAARHADADSGTAARSAALELASLDAASAAEARWLERYDTVTRRYLQQNPHDSRGLDALERVGSLAFAAERYERAESAYIDVARLVPERRRAAAALKVVGDTWWQRGRFDRAAEHYESALEQARGGRDDSLRTQLEVLVPGALYRAADAEQERGDRRAAVELLEHVAAQHPHFEFADRALYRAAQMHGAAGDTLRARHDLERFVRDFPSSRLHPDALLELAALQRARGAHAGAARTYRQLAVRHPRHAQARVSRLAAGELFERCGEVVAADLEYRTLLDSLKATLQNAADLSLAANLWMRRARLAPSLEDAAPHYESALQLATHLPDGDRGEALFQLSERQRPAYESVVLEQPLEESLAQKKRGLENVLRGYKSTLDAGVEPWHAAASLRLGECLVHLGDALQRSEPPTGLGEDDLVAYRQALAAQAFALEGRAVEAWSVGLRAARPARRLEAAAGGTAAPGARASSAAASGTGLRVDSAVRIGRRRGGEWSLQVPGNRVRSTRAWKHKTCEHAPTGRLST